MKGTVLASLLFAGVLVLPLSAQDTASQQGAGGSGQGPITLTSDRMQSINAISYRAGGPTMIDFRSTTYQPAARGEAKVESHTGRVTIKPKFVNLKPANSLGPEYLTYVLWAVTPEGRLQNLGEVVPNKDGKAELSASTNLQTFGLMVTAEPYFAVTRPSNRIILENTLRSDTKAVAQPIYAKFEALQGGDYVENLDPARLPATGLDPSKVPLELLQARNAVAIAKQSGAEKYASDAFRQAATQLANSESAYTSKQGKSQIVTAARSAVQSAEDARVLTVHRKQEEGVVAERQAAQQETEQARQQAAQAQQQALTAQQQAEQARQERAIAEAARQQALQQQQQAQAQAQQAQAQAQDAQQRAQQVEQEREQMRSQLQQELNQVMQTRDTARGLIVNMSDVLFDTAQATLRPGARLRLAKIAGIMAAHPDLQLAIEGHTDNVGGDSYNQQLSERRAEAVRDFLVSQGVQPRNVNAQGFGKTQPVATNDTPAGRQLNRRVDIVVSGQAIQSARAGQAPAVGAGTGAGASAGVNAGAGGVSGTTGAATGAGTTPPTGTPGTVAQPTTPQNPPQSPQQ